MTGLAVGDATVTAVTADGQSASATIHVLPAAPAALFFSTADIAALKNLKVGTNVTLSPYATFTDGTTGPIPASYTPILTFDPDFLASFDAYTVHPLTAGSGNVSLSLDFEGPHLHPTPASAGTVKP